MRAIALISGGLDSILAAKLVRTLGIDVIPLNFKIPFCKKTPTLPKDCLGSDVVTRDIGGEFLKLLDRPRYGFGSHMNPCIDCKILMLSMARRLLGEFGASFVVTGEVLGQRPMSQNRQALSIIEEKSGLRNLVLRPLSARLLPETIPEKQGWLKREDLLGFGGRTRKPQMELAGRLNISDYSQPAGGCLLTDPAFARRLKDVLANNELDIDNLELLKLGRHFRIQPLVKLVVGRDEKENRVLCSLLKCGDHLFFPGKDLSGPVSLARGRLDPDLISLCCAVTARYCDLEEGSDGRISYFRREKSAQAQILSSLTAAPAAESTLARLRI